MTRCMTPSQLLFSCCRKSRKDPYQKVVSFPNPHRQSGTFWRRSQVGFPMPPARWAIAVSLVMIRSQLLMMAAVCTVGVPTRLRTILMQRPTLRTVLVFIWVAWIQWHATTMRSQPKMMAAANTAPVPVTTSPPTTPFTASKSTPSPRTSVFSRTGPTYPVTPHIGSTSPHPTRTTT